MGNLCGFIWRYLLTPTVAASGMTLPGHACPIKMEFLDSCKTICYSIHPGPSLPSSETEGKLDEDVHNFVIEEVFGCRTPYSSSAGNIGKRFAWLERK